MSTNIIDSPETATLREYVAALEKLVLDEGCGRRCCACDAVVSIDESVEAYTDRGTVAFCRDDAPAWATA